MMVLQGSRQIASAWVIVVGLLFGLIIATMTVEALRQGPQQTIDWKGVTNPLYDGALVNRTSRPDDAER